MASGTHPRISVPFAKGTLQLLTIFATRTAAITNFSPLREGDTTVTATNTLAQMTAPGFQSPSRRGHYSYLVFGLSRDRFGQFQSPSRRGHYSYYVRRCVPRENEGFQSPSRRGHYSYKHCGDYGDCSESISVPFAKGTLQLHTTGYHNVFVGNYFSPLREGDTTVTSRPPDRPASAAHFSPLREGDTTVTIKTFGCEYTC